MERRLIAVVRADVVALAEALYGSPRYVLRLVCLLSARGVLRASDRALVGCSPSTSYQF